MPSDKKVVKSEVKKDKIKPKKDESAIKGTPVTSQDLRELGVEKYGDPIS